MDMKIDGDRLLKTLDTLKTYTDTPGAGVTRFSYGRQDVRARKYILERVKAAGCSVCIDPVQNIRISPSFGPAGGKSVMAGSHIDSVRNGGWLDGIYGVCGALEVMETLSEAVAKDPSLKDRFTANYEMVIFAEEEGSLFGSCMTGSKFISGIYDEKDPDLLKNDEGLSMRQILEGLKDLPEEDRQVYDTGGSLAGDLTWDLASVRTMIELHIEQGPVLDREGLSLGIVDSIFGMRVVEVEFSGVGNHAGATPMRERCDALTAAASAILLVEDMAKSDGEHRSVATCGKIEVFPGCSNVIPEKVRFTVEVRDRDEKKIDDLMDRIIDRIHALAQERHISCVVTEHSRSSPLHLSRRVITSMETRAREAGIPFKVMDSGAVHDACMIARHCDTGMIFVPSIDGRSHVPQEDTHPRDLIAGAQFLMDTILAEMS